MSNNFFSYKKTVINEHNAIENQKTMLKSGKCMGYFLESENFNNFIDLTNKLTDYDNSNITNKDIFLKANELLNDSNINQNVAIALNYVLDSTYKNKFYKSNSYASNVFTSKIIDINGINTNVFYNIFCYVDGENKFKFSAINSNGEIGLLNTKVIPDYNIIEYSEKIKSIAKNSVNFDNNKLMEK